MPAATFRIGLSAHVSAAPIAALSIAIASCTRPPAPAESATSTRADCRTCEQDVARVLDDFHDAAAQADEQRYFGHLTEDAVFLGTDATERWTKAEFLGYARPHFAKGKAWTFRSIRRTIAFDPSSAIAWFEEQLETENLGPARGSGVLVRHGDRWQIAQYNLAVTVPNERFALVKEAAATAQIVSAHEKDALLPLAWLAGAWVVEKPDGAVSLEVWTSPRGSAMIGSGHTTKAHETTFFEHLRIEARESSVVYVAQPRGGSPTEFTRTGDDPSALVFENLAHDWPKRLTYRRVLEGVRVRVEGDADQPVEEWTMKPAVLAREIPR